MIVIESISFDDDFTGSGGGGVPYLNGGVLGKHVATIEFHSYLAYKGKYLRFTATTKTIEIINYLDSTSFLDDGTLLGMGLKEDRTIAITNTISNNGNLTIASISEDGRTITVNEALTDEDKDGANIYDITPVTALDFYYNLIENNSQEDYQSLVDAGAIQRFIVDGIATGSSAPVNMLVGSSSFGWVTNNLINEATGETDEVTCEGRDMNAYRQRFKIIQTFKITPFGIAGQLNNFKNILAPDYFKDGKALKYICKIDGKFNFSDPEIPHTGSSADILGRTNWFNQNNIRSRAEYYFDSITYIDPDSVSVAQLDINKITDVSIIIKSRNGKFVTFGAGSGEGETEFVLDFFYLPLNESRYINTPDTTLIQNLLSDRAKLHVGEGANGEQNGTAYQVLTRVIGYYVDVNTIRIEFKVDFSAEIKTLLKTLPEENRNYVFCITTQSEDIITTIQNDRVPVLCEVNQIGWDKSNPYLIEAVDNLRSYHFPHINIHPNTSVGGWEGDPVYVEFPFRLLGDAVDGITPTLINAGFQIVAVKTGQEDFVLEEKIFDTSLVRKLEGVQTIDISETKNYKDMPDEYNVSSIKRDASFDSGGSSGSGGSAMNSFMSHHAFVLRYEYWAKVIQDAERSLYPIFENIEYPTLAWNTLQQNGWSLKVHFKALVEGYEGYQEVFDQYWNINCKSVGEAPDAGTTFTSVIEYRDVETQLIVNGIVAGKKTLITILCTGSFEVFRFNFNSLFAYIFTDLETVGGVTSRRFASSEHDSDDDSPFSAPAYLPEEGDIPTYSWASLNVRINIFNYTKVVIQTIYDDTKTDWSFRVREQLIYFKLGYMKGCFVLTEDGSFVLDESGQRILLETCES